MIMYVRFILNLFVLTTQIGLPWGWSHSKKNEELLDINLVLLILAFYLLYWEAHVVWVYNLAENICFVYWWYFYRSLRKNALIYPVYNTSYLDSIDWRKRYLLARLPRTRFFYRILKKDKKKYIYTFFLLLIFSLYTFLVCFCYII